MNISEFRKNHLEKIENDIKGQPTFRDFLNEVKSKRTPFSDFDFAINSDDVQDDVGEAVRIIRDEGEEVNVRIMALNGVLYEIGQSEELIELLFEILRNSDEPVEFRIAVLNVFTEMDFSSVIFRERRPQYLEILRNIVDEPNAELNQMAVEILAKSKDEYIQRRLLEGLQSEEQALVRPEKAIQLLGYDIHTEYFPILQRVAKDPSNLLAKNEAVRLLATDTDSKSLLTEILQDKSEHRRVRQTSAIALQSLSPAEFERQAERIIFDDDEYEDIRATCINALESPLADSLSDSKSLLPAADERRLGLLEKVEQLKEEASSKELKKVAQRYISKHRK